MRYSLEQAFILPLPKYRGPHFSEKNLQDETAEHNQIEFWRSFLDKIRDRKMSWEQFSTYLPSSPEEILMHPSVQLASDRKGQTFLHLAVLQEQNGWVDFLGGDIQLRQRRNNFGLTALELAQFLHRLPCIESLGGFSDAEFCSQVNVAIERSVEKIKNLFYLPYPIFENEDILDEVLEQSSKAKLEDKIPSEKIWMGIYFDKEIQTGLNPRISIRYINDRVGLGVFAEQKIHSCSFVGEYTGIVKERCKSYLKNKTYCVRYPSWQTGRRQFIIDAEAHGNYTRFINHSANPNVGLQSVYWRGMPRMIFITLKEIPEGTQLTFDYGGSFWKEMNQTPTLLL